MYHQEYGLIMVDMGWGWVLLLVKFQFSKVFFQIYPPAIKHGVLENPPFIEDFPATVDDTGGCCCFSRCQGVQEVKEEAWHQLVVLLKAA